MGHTGCIPGAGGHTYCGKGNRSLELPFTLTLRSEVEVLGHAVSCVCGLAVKAGCDAAREIPQATLALGTIERGWRRDEEQWNAWSGWNLLLHAHCHCVTGLLWRAGWLAGWTEHPPFLASGDTRPSEEEDEENAVLFESPDENQTADHNLKKIEMSLFRKTFWNTGEGSLVKQLPGPVTAYGCEERTFGVSLRGLQSISCHPTIICNSVIRVLAGLSGITWGNE